MSSKLCVYTVLSSKLAPDVKNLADILSKDSYKIEACKDFADAKSRHLSNTSIFERFILIADADEPEIIESMHHFAKLYEYPVCIILYSYTKNSLDEVMNLIKQGANDYFEVPADQAQFWVILKQRILELEKRLLTTPNNLGPSKAYSDLVAAKALTYYHPKDEPKELTLLKRFYVAREQILAEERFRKEYQQTGSWTAMMQVLLEQLAEDTHITLPLRSKSTVLVVDDETMIRENIKAILEDDFEVIEAINGETAVKLLTAPGAKEKIHAVLLDIMLPDISGVEVLSEIRNSYKHAFPCNRVIMLTAYDDPKFIDTAVGVRAADYLVKGVNFEAKSLIEKLRIITDREYYTAAFEELIAVLAEQRQV